MNEAGKEHNVIPQVELWPLARDCWGRIEWDFLPGRGERYERKRAVWTYTCWWRTAVPYHDILQTDSLLPHCCCPWGQPMWKEANGDLQIWVFYLFLFNGTGKHWLPLPSRGAYKDNTIKRRWEERFSFWGAKLMRNQSDLKKSLNGDNALVTSQEQERQQNPIAWVKVGFSHLSAVTIICGRSCRGSGLQRSAAVVSVPFKMPGAQNMMLCMCICGRIVWIQANISSSPSWD